MAKRISNGRRGVDLSAAAMSDDQVREAQALMELRMGMRCAGCGRRIAIGLQYTSVAPRDSEMPVMRLAACSRDDCDFAEQARDGATCVEAVEFVWLDELGVEAPAAAISPGAGATPIQ